MATPIISKPTKRYYKKASEIIAWLEENAAEGADHRWMLPKSNTWVHITTIMDLAGNLVSPCDTYIPEEWIEEREV